MAGEVLGTTRQVIGAFEATRKEAREPRVGEILALSSLYRISPETIMTRDLRRSRAPQKRPAAMERREAEDADDSLDDWEMEEATRAGSGIGEAPIRPDGVSDVQSAVAALRRVLGLGLEPPFDIFGGLLQGGFILEFTAMKSLAGALIPAAEARGPVVVVNSDQPDDRLRWTATHEAAHWILDHHPGERHADPFGSSRDPRELAADAVAGEILAPRETFAAAFGARDQSEPLGDAVYRLSRRFGMSYSAAALRAGELGLISPDIVTSLRSEKPTEIEDRLRLRVGTAFSAESAVPAAIAALIATHQLAAGWETVFGEEDGQRNLRRVQRAALFVYFEQVPEPARVTGVTQVFEQTARWVARHHQLVANV